MRYNWVTGPSLPRNVGMGVSIPLDLTTSAFSCLKSPKSTSVTRMVWAWPEDLGDKGVDNLSLQKAALWNPWGGTGRELQISAGIVLSLSCYRRNIFEISGLSSGFKPVNCSCLSNRLCNDFCIYVLDLWSIISDGMCLQSCWDTFYLLCII